MDSDEQKRQREEEDLLVELEIQMDPIDGHKIYMMPHVPTDPDTGEDLDYAEPIGWDASCYCGWNGPMRESHDQAEQDGPQHIDEALRRRPWNQ